MSSSLVFSYLQISKSSKREIFLNRVACLFYIPVLICDHRDAIYIKKIKYLRSKYMLLPALKSLKILTSSKNMCSENDLCEPTPGLDMI